MFVVLNVLSVVLLLGSTRPSSESQSQGDSRECSLLDHFLLRERGRVAESPSVVLGCSSRGSRVGEDWARQSERITPAWPVGSVAWRVLGTLSYLAFFPSRSLLTGRQSPSVVLGRSSRCVEDAEDHGCYEERRQLSWLVKPVELGDSNGAPGRRFSWTLRVLG